MTRREKFIIGLHQHYSKLTPFKKFFRFTARDEHYGSMYVVNKRVGIIARFKVTSIKGSPC